MVIYSMTTSPHSDAPREMHFLYSFEPIERGDLLGEVPVDSRVLAGAV
jgi:hypothetical protein